MTNLQTLLGIDLPIVQAPMAGVQGSALAVAVSNVGGLGSLPRALALLGLDAMSKELSAIISQTKKPFNVNYGRPDSVDVLVKGKRTARRASLLDADDAIGDAGEAGEDRRIVAGNEQPRFARHRSHPILRAQILDRVQRLRDRRVGVQVLVEIHVVGGDHDGM